MYVSELSLTDFRSYPHAHVNLAPGANLLLGANGQGKTNLVEAIAFLATLGSHRVSTDAPLIRAGASAAHVRADVVRFGRTTSLELIVEPGKARRARINRVATPRATALLGSLQVILFAPEDLALVKGDPADRRSFLDDVLIQRRPRMSGVRSDYDRVLRQRNALLKSVSVARRAPAGEVDRTLSVWDEQLIEHGSALIVARAGLVSEMAGPAAAAYAQLADDPEHSLDVRYASHVERWRDPMPGPGGAECLTDQDAWRSALRAAIAERRQEEVTRGLTLVGPHRDELSLTLGAFPARGYASHGESWSIALALRLASLSVMRAESDDPVLILDDVFAELDVRRRERLVSAIADVEQVIITAAVPQDVPATLHGRTLHISRGQVAEASE